MIKLRHKKASQQNEAETTSPVVTPLEQKSANEATVMDNVDNAVVRQENFSVVSGPEVKSFGVVVGSFSLKANAEGLQRTLKGSWI